MRLPDQARVAGVLHHDDEHMLEVIDARVVCIAGGNLCRSRKRHHQRQGSHYRDTDASHETLATSVAIHQINPPLAKKRAYPSLGMGILDKNALRVTKIRGWLK